MSLTYAQLSTAIQEYLEEYETTFVSNIPTFIRQAEERIYREVQLPSLRKAVTGTTTASNRFLGMPSDFLSVYEMAVIQSGVHTFLIPKEVAFLREAFPDVGYEGVPRYYALFDQDSFELSPTPDDAYTIQLNYQAMPASIVDAGSSWLGTNASAALLWGSIVEAYAYLKGDAELMKTYEMRYKEGLQELAKMGYGYMRRDSYRDGERTMNV